MQNIVLILLTCIFSIIEVFIIIKYFLQKKYNYFFEIVIIFVSMMILLYFEYIHKLRVNPYIIAAVIITILGHSFIGKYLDVYHKSKYYDRFLHLFGSCSFALFEYSLLYNTIKPINYSKLFTSLFVITLGISLGVLFELLEFTVDSFAKTPPHQHGLRDTNFDLVSDVIGSIIAGIISIYAFL